MSDTVGLNTADIISAAEAGQAFHVTVRGKDTGVVIAKQHPTPPAAERRHGITLDQIQQAGLYTRPTSTGYQDAMLEMIERGRDDAGRVGDHHR